MASSDSNEYNSQLSSSINKSLNKKSLCEHEESLKSNQMASKKLSNSSDGKVSFFHHSHTIAHSMPTSQ